MREKVQSFSPKLNLSNTVKQFLEAFCPDSYVYKLECSWIGAQYDTCAVCVRCYAAFLALWLFNVFEIQTHIFGFDLCLPWLRSKLSQ